ncbi:NAD(P)H-binding protein [Acidovorax lacteus]|uniref:NAD(P)H-binding protein n=1 Tax=Acidovorax lacteus TaxID=1924988 RepID=A0ABP8L1J6_9BURK
MLVAGATGLVGRCLVQQLCADPGVGTVHALVRKPLPMQHPKLHCHVVDFAALPSLPPLHEAYLALGTTIKVAGSQAAFRAVDFDANLAVAQAAHAAGAQRLGLVSALGADARSAVFYSRVKGELEDTLMAEPWAGLVIARPSMLAGDRASLGQPHRRGEALWGRVDAALGPLIPKRWRAIAAADVAAALAQAVPRARGTQVLSSAAMQGAAARAG